MTRMEPSILQVLTLTDVVFFELSAEKLNRVASKDTNSRPRMSLIDIKWIQIH